MNKFKSLRHRIAEVGSGEYVIQVQQGHHSPDKAPWMSLDDVYYATERAARIALEECEYMTDLYDREQLVWQRRKEVVRVLP